MAGERMTEPRSCAELADYRVAESVEVANRLTEPGLVAAVAGIGDLVVATLQAGRTLYFFGNGGSAADAGHLTAEFIGRCTRERGPLPALCLSDSTAVLTALGNDYGYEHVFARQVAGLVKPGDLVFGMSCSGNSANVLDGLAEARNAGATTVGLSGGTGGKLADVCDYLMLAPTDVTGRMQEVHKLWGHIWAEWAEWRLFP